MKRLRLKGYEAPYFIGYTLRDIEEAEVTGKLGAVYSKARDRRRVIHVEVRVGNYDFDNTSAGESEGDADLALSLSEVSKDAPLDDNLDALRGSLWLLTDQKYKAALASYARKRARGVRDVEPEDKLPSFSREKPQKFVGDMPRYEVDLDKLSLAEMQTVEPGIDRSVYGVLTVEASVAARRSLGGTAPANVARAAKEARGRYLAKAPRSAKGRGR